MATPIPTTTGPGSTSFAVWLVTFLPGLASGVTALLQNGTPTHTAVFGLGGGVVALVSTLGKLLHDKGLHVATIQAGAADIATQLPQLSRDAAIAAGFVTHDIPGLQARLDALEAKAAPTVDELRPVVAAVLSSLNTPAPPQP